MANAEDFDIEMESAEKLPPEAELLAGKSLICFNNLPIPLSTFIGRKREIAEIKKLLFEHRLLTLTGPGGCGKTRLAMQAAHELREAYPDGVWITELASLAEGDLVVQAVASTFGVREQAGYSIGQSLLSHLQSRTVLLVLDNCEHLVEACAQLSAALLPSCPAVRFLTTSREPLGVPGEAVWTVPPLSLPDPQPWLSPGREKITLESYQQSEAVQLFVARAGMAAADFRLTAENGPWVAEICRRLDGIPLAIELAAARLRALSVRQIAERLDDRFRLLTSHLRTVPPRHQTLEATLDWSYTLLSTTEQEVFRQLCVFAIGWTLEAAEAVCAGSHIEPAEVMNVLSNLIDKSLVEVDNARSYRRYRLLETIRQFGHHKLVEGGEINAVRDRHLDYFVGWAEMGVDHFTGPDQAEWLERFEADHDNIRSALEWSLSADDKADLGLRLAIACGRFWRLYGYLSEGRERLSAAIGRIKNQERTAARAWALTWSANLAYFQSDYSATRDLTEEALEIFRGLGPAGRLGVSRALDLLGELATEVGDYETGVVLLEDALSIYRELQEPRGIADMLMQLGWAAMRSGDYHRADPLLQECLPLCRALGESGLLGEALAGLGELAIRQNRLDRANEFLEESLAIRREMGERWGTAVTLGSLGWARMLQRDFDPMRALLRESLEIRMKIGDQGGIAWCLEKLAEAIMVQTQSLPSAQRRGALRRAVWTLGSAAALRASLNSAIDPADQPNYQQILRALRRTLGSEFFDATWDEGGGLPLQEVVDHALSPVLAPAEAVLLSDSQAAKSKFGGLSRREREVAVLIAQGKSNREIAAVMVVGVKTVETYITRMLNKLGFDSRVQVATWAIEVGLAGSAGDVS